MANEVALAVMADLYSKYRERCVICRDEEITIIVDNHFLVEVKFTDSRAQLSNVVAGIQIKDFDAFDYDTLVAKFEYCDPSFPENLYSAIAKEFESNEV